MAGGTICMSRKSDGSLAPAHSIEEVVKMVPRIDEVAELSYAFVSDVDSTNVHPQIWTELTKTIEENYELYDGFVVTHGTDTLAYTASALSYSLQNLTKPVVLTGAQKPPFDIATDAINNLINAVIVATMPVTEVCVVFGTSILRGNRSQKRSEVELQTFHSPIAFPIGQITLEPHLYSEQLYKPNGTELKVMPEFNSNVAVMKLVPGFRSDYLQSILEKGCQGIVLEAYGPGNIPNEKSPFSLLEFIRETTKSGIPFLVTTQCPVGATSMQMYEVGHQAFEAGAIPGYNMTTEAAATKLMWALAQTQDLAEIRTILETNLAGEVTLPEKK